MPLRSKCTCSPADPHAPAVQMHPWSCSPAIPRYPNASMALQPVTRGTYLAKYCLPLMCFDFLSPSLSFFPALCAPVHRGPATHPLRHRNCKAHEGFAIPQAMPLVAAPARIARPVDHGRDCLARPERTRALFGGSWCLPIRKHISPRKYVGRRLDPPSNARV